MKSQYHNTREAHESEINAMRARVDELENSLHNYHHQLNVALTTSINAST